MCRGTRCWGGMEGNAREGLLMWDVVVRMLNGEWRMLTSLRNVSCPMSGYLCYVWCLA